MIVEERHEPHLRRSIIIAGNGVVAVFDLLCVAAGAREDTAHFEIEGIIHDGIQLERATALRARVGAAL
jgi:hypothetical protein